MIDWILCSPTKRVLNYSCPHHDEIITYFTGIECTYFPIIFGAKYWHKPIHSVTNGITHIGNLSNHHKRRKQVINSLKNSNVQISVFQVYGLNMSTTLNSCLASLNCSLNCDISHRVSESLAAGTLLYTDRLTKYQQFIRFLETEGLVNLYDFNNIARLIDSINGLKEKYATPSGKNLIFEEKIIIQKGFIRILKNFNLYKLAAAYIMLKEVCLPGLLTPVITFFPRRLNRQVLSCYEDFQERHKNLDHRQINPELTSDDFLNYKLLCSRISSSN